MGQPLLESTGGGGAKRRGLAYFGPNGVLVKRIAAELESFLQDSLALQIDQSTAEFSKRYLESKLGSLESALKCGVQVASQTTGRSKDVLHLFIEDFQLQRKSKDEQPSHTQSSALQEETLKGELAKVVESRMQSLQVERWVLLLPPHLLSPLEKITPEFPFAVREVCCSEDRPMWLV